MPKFLPLALLAALALPAFAGDPPATAAPKPADSATKSQGAAPAGEHTRRHGRFGSEEDEKAFYKQLAEDTPELRGVDPKTPEGEKKFKEVLEAKHKKGEMPEVGIMMKVLRTKNHARLRQLFNMPQEEFAAIEPLLARVEQLRSQKLFADIPTTIRGLGIDQAMGGGADAQAQQDGINTFIKGLMGNAIDPAVQECRDAADALKTILKDEQANAVEKAGAVARVRKARVAYFAALEKAQLELRGVLTAHQEAQLVDYGILD